MAMSQHQHPHHPNQATAAPQQRPDHDPEDTVDQPSSWNDPQFQCPGENAGDDERHDDTVVIVDDDEAPSGAYPRRRPQLPYGRGFVKPEGAVSAELQRRLRSRAWQPADARRDAGAA